MVCHEAKIQIGISKVVNKIKNSEIPSIPKLNDQLKVSVQDNLIVYWKSRMELSKFNHNRLERGKQKAVTQRAILRLYSKAKGLLAKNKIERAPKLGSKISNGKTICIKV